MNTFVRSLAVAAAVVFTAIAPAMAGEINLAGSIPTHVVEQTIEAPTPVTGSVQITTTGFTDVDCKIPFTTTITVKLTFGWYRQDGNRATSGNCEVRVSSINVEETFRAGLAHFGNIIWTHVPVIIDGSKNTCGGTDAIGKIALSPLWIKYLDADHVEVRTFPWEKICPGDDRYEPAMKVMFSFGITMPTGNF